MYNIVTKNNLIINITDGDILRKECGLWIDKEKVVIPYGENISIYSVDNIPDYVKPIQYFYENESFIKNNLYKESYSKDDRISSLEDVINSLLGF